MMPLKGPSQQKRKWDGEKTRLKGLISCARHFLFTIDTGYDAFTRLKCDHMLSARDNGESAIRNRTGIEFRDTSLSAIGREETSAQSCDELTSVRKPQASDHASLASYVRTTTPCFFQQYEPPLASPPH